MEIIRLDFSYAGLGNVFENRSVTNMSNDAHSEKITEMIPTITAISLSNPQENTPLILQNAEGSMQTIEAPAKVVPPGTLGLTTSAGSATGSPTVSTGGGTAIQGDVAAGKDFAGRDAIQNDVRYSSVGSSVNFLNPDNAALWQASMKLLQDMTNIAHRLDSIPERLSELEKFVNAPKVTVPVSVPLTVPIMFPMQSWLVLVLIGLVLTIGAFLIGKIL